MSIILSTQKEEWKKETKKEGKEGRKKAGKREREMLFKCMSIYQWFLTLWSSEFSRAIIFSSAPRKSSCWNAGSNVFLGLKKKNAFIFLSLLKDGLPGLTGFFVVAPPPHSQHLKDVSGLRTIGQELSCHSCLSLCHFPPLSLVCSNLTVFYFHFLCAFSACIQMSGCIYRCFLTKFGHLMRFHGFISNLERSAMASNIFLDIRFYPPFWVYSYMYVLPLELYS